jgi:hypothetical protein
MSRERLSVNGQLVPHSYVLPPGHTEDELVVWIPASSDTVVGVVVREVSTRVGSETASAEALEQLREPLRAFADDLLDPTRRGDKTVREWIGRISSAAMNIGAFVPSEAINLVKAVIDREFNMLPPDEQHAKLQPFERWSNEFLDRTTVIAIAKSSPEKDGGVTISFKRPRGPFSKLVVRVFARRADTELPPQVFEWNLVPPGRAFVSLAILFGVLVVTAALRYPFFTHLQAESRFVYLKHVLQIGGIATVIGILRGLIKLDGNQPIVNYFGRLRYVLLAAAAIITAALAVPRCFRAIVNDTAHALHIGHIEIPAGDYRIWYAGPARKYLEKGDEPACDDAGSFNALDECRREQGCAICSDRPGSTPSRESGARYCVVQQAEDLTPASKVDTGQAVAKEPAPTKPCEIYPGYASSTMDFGGATELHIGCAGKDWRLHNAGTFFKEGVTFIRGRAWIEAEKDSCRPMPSKARVEVRDCHYLADVLDAPSNVVREGSLLLRPTRELRVQGEDICCPARSDGGPPAETLVVSVTGLDRGVEKATLVLESSKDIVLYPWPSRSSVGRQKSCMKRDELGKEVVHGAFADPTLGAKGGDTGVVEQRPADAGVAGGAADERAGDGGREPRDAAREADPLASVPLVVTLASGTLDRSDPLGELKCQASPGPIRLIKLAGTATGLRSLQIESPFQSTWTGSVDGARPWICVPDGIKTDVEWQLRAKMSSPQEVYDFRLEVANPASPPVDASRLRIAGGDKLNRGAFGGFHLTIEVESGGRSYEYGSLTCGAALKGVRPARVLLDDRRLVGDVTELHSRERKRDIESDWSRHPTWSSLGSSLSGWKSPWICTGGIAGDVLMLAGAGPLDGKVKEADGEVLVDPHICPVIKGTSVPIPTTCGGKCEPSEKSIPGCRRVLECDCSSPSR